MIISLGPPHQDATEIAQDSLANARLDRGNFRGNVSDSTVFGASLRGVAKSKHRNCARSRRRRARRVKLADVGDLHYGDDQATLAAVKLMQHYGVPEDIDFPRLRSFVRPSKSERPIGLTSRISNPMYPAIRMRLRSLVDVPNVTLGDYIRYEKNLWMAILLVLLCCYATFRAPAGELEGDPNVA